LELSDVNHGIAKGYNKLIKKAKGENIVLLTNDILLDENWLVELIHWNSMVDKAGTTSIHCEGVKGSYSPLLNKSDSFTRVWLPPSGFTFGATLINRDALDAVGLFDERLGLYGREREQYCTRLKELGFNNFYIPEQYSIHLGRQANDDSFYETIKEDSMQLASSKYNQYLNDMRKNKNFKL
jgi:GT2 family glycosyltransferase